MGVIIPAAESGVEPDPVLPYGAMATGCPKCGWQELSGAQCPRCGVNIAEYRAQLAVASAVARPPEARWQPPRSEAPRPTAPPSPTIHPAGFWIRFVAIIVDGLCLALVQWVLGFVIVALFFGAPGTLAAIVGLYTFNVLLGSIYPVIFHWRWGQTLGKMAMSIRVVTVDGGALSLGTAIIRQIGYWVSLLTLCIGYLMAAFRSDKRALHDLMAGTRVEHIA
jgi:uncharacterized RDD family membrane protein YckC